MLEYDVREWHIVTYQMDVSEFKHYIKELRFFYNSYLEGQRQPKFIQLLRSSSQGFVTECATLPLSFIGSHEVEDIDLDNWFEGNYEKVYEYLLQNNTKLY